MAERSRPLSDLVAAMPSARLVGDGTVLISDVTHDSRAAGQGALFCCIPGAHYDGHLFAAAAVAQGAAALLVQRHLPSLSVPQVEVPDTRAALGPLAAEFWGHPSLKLAVVGVTGTNGKTTVAHMLAAILSAAGRSCQIMGTLSGPRTTPEATDLQRRLALWADEGLDSVVMEVSSHALALGRVDGMHFAAGVFTNLSRDHLDFHGNMSAYFQAKARLFEVGRVDRGVVNLDDPHGRLLRDAAQVPTVGYRAGDATDVETSAQRSTFRWRDHAVAVALGGRHNLLNALAAATAAAELGIGADAIVAGLATMAPVPGRFEPVEAGQPFSVLVDFAHTPDALERVLEAGREMAEASQGRLSVVFGCGGDRDPSKRAPMGAVAERLADVVVITSDNSRHEDPAAIIAEIRSVIAADRATVEADRRRAIRFVLSQSRAGDVVVIAGKGHETTQMTGDKIEPFDDRVVAAQELAALGYVQVTQ